MRTKFFRANGLYKTLYTLFIFLLKKTDIRFLQINADFYSKCQASTKVSFVNLTNFKFVKENYFLFVVVLQAQAEIQVQVQIKPSKCTNVCTFVHFKGSTNL